MTYSLGVDVGTTFTAAAVWRDGRAETVQLGDRGFTVPSVVFLRDDGEVLVGDAANRRAVTEPGRVAREFKRRLGDEVPLLLGGQAVTAQALTGHLLRWVAGRVTEREGRPPARVTLTCPANWSGYRRDLIARAAADAGLTDVRLLTEPEAAATYYAAQGRLDPGDTVGVYDLGGGTFDATVLRRTGTGFELVGEPSGDEQLGGVDFDQAVMDHVVGVLGDDWTRLDLDDPVVVRGIAQLLAHVVDAKEALSTDIEIAIPVILPGINREVRLTRTELEEMVRQPLLRTIATFRETVEEAGVDPRALRAILLVGGSSRIPLVAELIASELGTPVAVDAHPKFAVCLGAAIDASAGITGATDPAATTAILALPPADVPRRQRVAGPDGQPAAAGEAGGPAATLIAGAASAAKAPAGAPAGAAGPAGDAPTAPVDAAALLAEPDIAPTAPGGPPAGEVNWPGSHDPGMSWWDAPDGDPAGGGPAGPVATGVATGGPVQAPEGPPGVRPDRTPTVRPDSDGGGRRRAMTIVGAAVLVAVVAVVGLSQLSSGGGGGDGGDGTRGPTTTRQQATTTTTPLAERIPAVWTDVTEMNVPLEAAGVTTHEGKLWVVGGKSPDTGRPDLRDVQVLDPDTGAWSDGPRLPRRISHGVLVSDGESLYLIGGEGPAAFATVLRLDEPDGEWQEDTPLPEPRTAAAGAWDGKRIVFGGGFKADKETRASDVWALEDGAWRPIGKLQQARDHLAATSDGAGTVWFLGGARSGEPGRSGAVDVVTADGVGKADQSVQPRRAPAAFWLPGVGPCLVGGQATPQPTGSVSCLDSSRNDDFPELSTARAALGAAVLDDRALYTVGGFGGPLLGSDIVEALEFERP